VQNSSSTLPRIWRLAWQACFNNQPHRGGVGALGVAAAAVVPHARASFTVLAGGLHSSTYQLTVSTFRGIRWGGLSLQKPKQLRMS